MIIVEVKKQKGCCRKEPIQLNEGLFEDFLTSNIGKSMRTYLQKQVAKVLAAHLFGEPTPAVKMSITYKTVMEALAQVDLKDLIGVVKGDTTACRAIAENVMVAIMKVVNDEIADEMSEFAQTAGENISGGPNPIFNSITKALSGSEQIIARIAAEEVKEMEELDAFANSLCELEWAEMLKAEFSKVPGIGFIMDKVFG